MKRHSKSGLRIALTIACGIVAGGAICLAQAAVTRTDTTGINATASAGTVPKRVMVNNGSRFMSVTYPNPIVALAWSSSGVLACADNKGNVYFDAEAHDILDESSRNAVLDRPASPRRELTKFTVADGARAGLSSLAWTNNGDLVCLTRDGAQLWDVESGKLLRQVPPKQTETSRDTPTVTPAVFDSSPPTLTPVLLPGPQSVDAGMAVSPSGRWLAVAHWDTKEILHDKHGDSRSYSTSGHIQIWDISTGKLHRTTAPVAARVLDAAWSADGSTLASNCGDNTIRLWHTRTGKIKRTLRTSASCMALSSNGAELACADSSRIRVWKTDTGKLTRTIRDRAVKTLTFESQFYGTSGNTLSCLTASGVQMYHSRTGRRIHTIKLNNPTAIVYTPPFNKAGAVAIVAAKNTVHFEF